MYTTTSNTSDYYNYILNNKKSDKIRIIIDIDRDDNDYPSNYLSDYFYYDKFSKSAFSADPCRGCPNNPINGGSGICLCTLGTRNFYY